MARPREFEPEQALLAITETFWAKGFEGTSLQDLVESTGLKKGSLYAAFGDKRAMYHAALRTYDTQEITKAVGQLRQPGTPVQKIGRLFDAVLQGVASGASVKGCLICNAAIDQAPTDEAARTMLSASIGRMERALTEALGGSGQALRRKAQGLLASYFGLRVMAKSGAALPLLEAIRDEALTRVEGS